MFFSTVLSNVHKANRIQLEPALRLGASKAMAPIKENKDTGGGGGTTGGGTSSLIALAWGSEAS